MNGNDNNAVNNGIRAALNEKAKKEKTSSPLWEIDPDFLNPNDEPLEIRTWLKIGDRPAFPKNDVIVIDSKAKNGKSFCAYAAMIPLLKGQTFGNATPLDRPNRVIIFDSEMSRNTLLLRYKAIRASIGDNSDNLLIVPMLALSTKEMWDKVKSKVEIFNPDIVIVDNVSNMVEDVNDNREAKNAHDFFRKMKDDRTVIIIIHQNKNDDNATGALGTAMMRLQSERYSSERNGAMFTMKPIKARDNAVDDAEPFVFAVESGEDKMVTRFIDATEIADANRRKEAERWRAEMRQVFGDKEEMRRCEILVEMDKRTRDRNNKVAFDNAVASGAIAKRSSDKQAPYFITKDE